MSGSTSELNLKTAVDADDTADYLTLSLADSLRTVDALYNNVTGHTHNGAHQGGPIGAIPAGSIPDGSITSAKIADGTIATADLADRSVTNIKLASDTARANLLTNGGFEIWQRGNGPFSTASAFGPDRWVIGGGSGAVTINRSTSGDVASAYSVQVAVSGLSGGQQKDVLYQQPELGSFRGKTVCLSLRVSALAANSFRLRMNDGVTGAQTSAYNTLAGPWETISMVYPVASNAVTLTCNIEGWVNGTHYLDNAMLVVGSVPADYAPLHPADDLARCLRYYETTATGGGIGYPYFAQYGAAGQYWRSALPFAAKKSLTPTVTIGATGAWSLSNCAAPILGGQSVDGVIIQSLVTATGLFSFGPLTAAATIVAESNP